MNEHKLFWFICIIFMNISLVTFRGPRVYIAKQLPEWQLSIDRQRVEEDDLSLD